jgi:hypothetical protein
MTQELSFPVSAGLEYTHIMCALLIFIIIIS